MKGFKYIWILFLFMLITNASGQDPHFTQFFSNQLYLAPSFAGATQQHRFSGSFRDQWPTAGLVNTYVTYAFTYDHYFANFNSGVGLLFLNDVAGTGRLSNMNIGLLYSYDFTVFNFWHIRPGVSFIYKQRSIDYDALEFYGELGTEADLPYDGATNIGDFDAGTSVLVYADKIWFGTTVDHLTRPDNAFASGDYLPMKISVFGGYQIIRKGRLLKPIDETVSIAFRYKNQKPTDQLDIGLYWYKSPLVFGLWYRGIPIINEEKVGDMLAVLVGAKIPQFSIGYSYDFTVSKLVGQTGGAHEVAMIYEFKTTRRRKIHSIPCPEF